VEDAATVFGVAHAPDVERNELGTPRLDSIFRVAEEHVRTTMLCYVNADIMLGPDFLVATSRLADFSRSFIATGRRFDVEVFTDLSEGLALQSELGRLRACGTLHEKTGLDYFLFRRGLYADVPPFAIGRTVWDNWLLWAARRRGAALIDATDAITALHQRHDYDHVRGGEVAAWRGPEARRNLQLAGGYGHTAQLDEATHRLSRSGELIRLPAVPVRLRARRLLSTVAFEISGRRREKIDLTHG
jgi:hypothetical protein